MIICLNANCPLSHFTLCACTQCEIKMGRPVSVITAFILFVRVVQHMTTWPYVRLRSRGECANVFVLHILFYAKGIDCRGQSLDSPVPKTRRQCYANNTHCALRKLTHSFSPNSVYTNMLSSLISAKRQNAHVCTHMAALPAYLTILVPSPLFLHLCVCGCGVSM